MSLNFITNLIYPLRFHNITGLLFGSNCDLNFYLIVIFKAINQTQ